jgi:hypothetical protein
MTEISKTKRAAQNGTTRWWRQSAATVLAELIVLQSKDPTKPDSVAKKERFSDCARFNGFDIQNAILAVLIVVLHSAVFWMFTSPFVDG